MKSLYTLLAILTIIYALQAQQSIYADPDCIRSGFFITHERVPDAYIGERLKAGPCRISAMIEARNEKRFNQALLPNHNWRGVVEAELNALKVPFHKQQLFLDLSFKHESAHPTMGIVEPTTRAFDMIYDNTYRRMMLNSVNFSGKTTVSGGIFSLSGLTSGHFFFFSKNTPELSSEVLSSGFGYSLGGQVRAAILKQASMYASLFYRSVFDGFIEAEGEMYQENGSALYKILARRPVLNKTNTLAAKSGLLFGSGDQVKTAIFAAVLWGGKYGFVDSRDRRLTAFAGIDFIR